MEKACNAGRKKGYGAGCKQYRSDGKEKEIFMQNSLRINIFYRHSLQQKTEQAENDQNCANPCDLQIAPGSAALASVIYKLFRHIVHRMIFPQ